MKKKMIEMIRLLVIILLTSALAQAQPGQSFTDISYKTIGTDSVDLDIFS